VHKFDLGTVRSVVVGLASVLVANVGPTS